MLFITFVAIIANLIHSGYGMPEPFDFGLMGPDIMDGVASACRSGKHWDKFDEFHQL